MTETLPDILRAVQAHKPCSRRQLYRYLATLRLKPIHAIQRPARYPAGTTTAVLHYLGLMEGVLR